MYVMKKIGRNERCPCKSGKKFKHCCALKPEALAQQVAQESQIKVSLTSAVRDIQNAAVQRENVFKELGVFLFFATTGGDAWVFEVTESDCVQVAKDGVMLDLPFDENPETIEINWSHTFGIIDKRVIITSYEDKAQVQLDNAPSKEIHAAVRRIKKKLSPEMLSQVHVQKD